MLLSTLPLQGAYRFDYDDPLNCSSSTFADDANSALPRNIRIEWNTFQDNNTGAMGMFARRVGLRNNTFLNNYIDPPPGQSDEGGTVFFSQCSDQIQIWNNTFTGPSTHYGTGGMELWGRNIDVEGNEMTNYGREGIGANSAYNLTIQNLNTYPSKQNNAHNNDMAPDFSIGGIWIASREAPYCHGLFRDTDRIQVDGTYGANISTDQDYGMDIESFNQSANIVDHLTVKDNILTGKKYPLFIDPFVSLLNCPSDVCFDLRPKYGDPLTSAAVVPYAVGVSPRCYTGSYESHQTDRTTFTFVASEAPTTDAQGQPLLGANNISTIDVVFSSAGSLGRDATPPIPPPNDVQGAGGPDVPNSGANGCHFIYDVAGQQLQVQDQLAFDFSLVGSGGNDAGGNACVIHGGSSWVETYGNAIKLHLDIDFTGKPQLKGTRYIYATVTDGLGHSSDTELGNGWTFIGFWNIP